MDLTLTDDEEAFALEAREWLEANVEQPPSFATVDDEVAWGRAMAGAARGRPLGRDPLAGRARRARSATPVQVALFNAEYARARAPQPVNRVGINLAGPTLLAHGTDDQRRAVAAVDPRRQRDLVPAVQRARRRQRPVVAAHDGDAGRRAGGGCDGQKVWTSYAALRTVGDLPRPHRRRRQPRHAGISYFVLDMEASGIDIRPLTQITGEAEFNEVFLDGAFVPDDHLVGGARRRLAGRRTRRSRTSAGPTFPFKEQVVHESYLDELWTDAVDGGLRSTTSTSPTGWPGPGIEVRLLRLHNWRTLSRLSRGEEPGPESSLVKLAWTDATQHLSATALDVVGAEAPLAGRWQRQWLWSKAASIAGGTSEIQRTILAERLLGLPRS